MKKLLIALLFTGSALAADLPDHSVTPGFTNPSVTQANVATTICKIGYTGTIRPTVGYTNKLKLTQMAAAKLPGKPSDYEEDHLISLELGGNPTDPRNLWPQPWKPVSGWGARKKDVLETYLKRQVCGGRVTLAQAQADIAGDWIAAYKKYGLK